MGVRWDGREIVSLRVQLGLTQAELAGRLGVDQATVSRWERGLRSPEPRARLQLNNLLGQNRISTELSRETALVEHSPFPMTIISRDWQVIAASPALWSDGALRNPERQSFQVLQTTADIEYAMSVLREAGFFEGKVGAARIIARGFLVDAAPRAFSGLCTPILVRGEICRLTQYEFLTDAEFAKRRSEQGVVQIVTPS